jgi:hypothetical protein
MPTMRAWRLLAADHLAPAARRDAEIDHALAPRSSRSARPARSACRRPGCDSPPPWRAHIRIVELAFEPARRRRRPLARGLHPLAPAALHPCSLQLQFVRHQRAQYTLAYAPIGDAQPLGGPQIDNHFEDRAARHDEIGALGPDAGEFRARLGNRCPASRWLRSRIAWPVRSARRPRGDHSWADPGGGWRASSPCPRCRAGARAGARARAAFRRRARRHRRRAPASAHRPRATRLVVADMRLAFGQRDHAPGREYQSSMLGAVALLLLEQDQFGRAAADIEDQAPAHAGLEQGLAAADGEPRLLLGGDDLEPDAGLGVHALDEVAPVDGAAAGFGRDRADQGDVRRRNLSAQIASAATARSIAASDSRPRRPALRPAGRSAKRHRRRRSRRPAGRAISSRQLLVPRSSAA